MKWKFTLKGDAEFEFEAGRSSLWKATDACEDVPDNAVKNAREDYTWAYFAAEQNGMLEELGVAGMPVKEAVESLADRFDLEISKASGPLAASPVK